jgi:hypothetical protein
MVKKATTKNVSNNFVPLVLPSNDKQLSIFVHENRLPLMSYVIEAIEYAVSKNLPTAEVFAFKDTEFIVTVNSSTFRENVEQIYEYYIKTERYELCHRVMGLIKKLTHEKQKTSR